MTAARTRAVSVVAEALADQLGVTGISEVWRDVAEAVVAALEAAGIVDWQEGEG